MTTQRDSYLQALDQVRQGMTTALEGMDYCLDWKLSDEEWSPREVLYHLLDTPKGGAQAAVKEILDGTLSELTIVASLTNLTPERQSVDLETLRQELMDWFAVMEEILKGANDSQLSQRKATVHLPHRSATEERTAQELVEGVFLRHWREHLEQLNSLREQLGLS